MALLSLHDVSLNLGGPQLLDEVALHLEAGERACLVGRNGAGKSTLMRLIGGEIAPDSGRISFQKGATWAYLPQDVAAELNGPARQIILDGRDVPAYEIDALLMQLKIDGEAEFKTLSGGQQRRALLARALAGEPDLLLLDEPTNHLDIESIQWLEEYLLKSGRGNGKSLLFVTHDRAFLQNLATRIIEIDRAKIYSYECDYETFLTRREERIESQIKSNAVFDALLQQEEAWIRRGVKARTTRNEGRVRALQKMRQERSARREGSGKATMQAQDVERSGMEVINADDVSFSYEAGKPLVRDFSTLVIRGDKLGFVGPNGGGKTTLLKVLLGEIVPQQGRVKLGTRLHLAYFDQNRGGLDGDKSVRWNVAGENDTVSINGERRHIVGYLQEWLFSPERIRQPVKTLSGGERSRLLLAKLFTQPANVLVMDEPTNDLDIETLELLEEMLVAFPGTVIVVSHDRAFLNNVVTGTLSPDGDGYWSEFVGGYDDLMRQRRAQNGHQSTLMPSSPKKVEATKPIVRPKRISFNEKRELESLPALIEKLEAENAALIEKMSDAEFYKGDSSQIAAVKKRMDEIEVELERAFARWEELEAMLAASV